MPTRTVGHPDQPGPDPSLTYPTLTTTNRSVLRDLDDESDRDSFRRLAKTADIVVESFPPGYLDGLGLGYEGLCGLREDIIVTSITGFGATGPHAGYLAPDIVGVAMAGIMWLAGDPQDPPNLPFGNQGYLSASVQAASGTMMALYHRDATGEGQHVDVSMQEALLIAQETAMQSYDLNKSVRNRTGARGIIPIAFPGIGPYESSDGWIWGYVGTPGGAPLAELLKWMEEEGKAEDLGDEPFRGVIEQLDIRFLTGIILDPEKRKETLPLLGHINEVFTRFCAGKTKWELYEQGQGRRLLIGIVSTPEDLVKNPQLTARNWLQDVRHEELDATIRTPGPPVRLSETPWRIASHAPLARPPPPAALG